MNSTSSPARKTNGHMPADAAASMLARYLPPADLELERQVVGCAMFRLDSLDRVGFLREEMFHGEINQLLYRELVAMRQAGKTFDDVLFIRRMQQVQPRDGGQWDIDLAAIAGSVIHAEHIVHYAEQVRELWIKRQAIYAATSLIHAAHQGADFPADLANHQTALQRLAESGESSEPLTMTAACLELMGVWESPDAFGVSSGFPDLDRLTRGLLPEAVYVVAGRPGQGKTGLALAIADTISRESAVLVFTLEMSRSEILARIVSRLLEMPAAAIARAVRDNRAPEALGEVLQQLSQRRIVIDGRDHLTVDQIASAARVQAGKGKLGLVIIDYLQLISPRDRRVNREQQISESSRAIKQLAKQIRCPILLLSQMSRAVELREGKQPQLSDLRESGAIEQDADAVMFIHEDRDAKPGTRQLLIRKNRNGPLGAVDVEWLPQFTTFKPIDRQWHAAESFNPMEDQ